MDPDVDLSIPAERTETQPSPALCALANVAVSILAGLGAAFLGLLLAQAVTK